MVSAGVDPTDAFLDVARKRARDLGVVGAEYRNGDVRALPYPDHHMDGAFCEKVLAAPNPAWYFAQAGLQQVRTRAYLAHTDRLGDPPFWRAFLVEQLPLFVGAGLLQPEEAEALGADLQALDARGWFRASFVVYTAVGTKPA
jgi:hypothetical protein